MIRMFALLCLLIALSPGCVKKDPKVEILRPAYIDAVRPIQVLNENMTDELRGMLRANGWEFTQETFVNICTASSINRAAHLWITAAHCVTGIGSEGRFIEKQPVEVIVAKTDTDLAVIGVPAYIAGQELRRQLKPAYWGQDIIVAGHPFGYDDLFVTRGYVANPKLLWTPQQYMAFDVAGAPGNSGSPVVNLKGELVSVLQVGWGRSFSPVTGGATSEYLAWFDRYFTPRNTFTTKERSLDTWPDGTFLREPF